MRKVLNIDDDFDFSLIGISCHAKDYRLYWEINRAMSIDLEKKNHLVNEQLPDVAFSNAVYYDEENHIDYLLVNNKSEGGMLIPEYPQLDYFFKIVGPQHDYEAQNCKSLLYGIDMVLTLVDIDPEQLKTKVSLIF